MSILVGQPVTPAQAMRLAIEAGRVGHGHVSPNPLVGCSIVGRDGRLLSVGAHRKVGFAHAEIDALGQIEDRSLIEGAHFYVTLEPCAHQGRTPSCARTIAPLKAASVTYAVEDPNPLVAGKGAAILREAGVQVWHLRDRKEIAERAELEQAAEELAEIFLHNHRTGEPFIAVKIASSLDGQIALASGESQWITSEAARAHTHLMRARYDAVAVGRTTFTADNPSLNIRHPSFPDLVNRAVVFDPSGRILSHIAGSRLAEVRPLDAITVVVGESVTESADCKILRVPLATAGGFEMSSLLKALKADGFSSLMIEGGALTIGAFMKARKVQRLHAYLAPTLIGGQGALSWSSGFGIARLEQQVRLKNARFDAVGPDLHWTGVPQFTPAG